MSGWMDGWIIIIIVVIIMSIFTPHMLGWGSLVSQHLFGRLFLMISSLVTPLLICAIAIFSFSFQ